MTLNKSSAALMLAAASALFSTAATAHDGDGYSARVDDHAPIGVMADHFHRKGEWMASARLMLMSMDDPRMATGAQKMSGTMVMAGMMYAPADWVTLTAGLSWADRDITMAMPMGGMMGGTMESEMSAKGIGDLKLNALFPVIADKENRFLLKAGITLPTGKNGLESDAGTRLMASMQPGTGSYAFTPAATYVRFGEGWSLGLQAAADLYLDHNDYGEKTGDQYKATAWASYTLVDNLSASVRVAQAWDKPLKSAMVMGGETSTQTTLLGGFNYVIRSGALKGNRFAVEVGLPVGGDRGWRPLKPDTSLTLGWQLAW
ncbi:transporter [Pseudokordiimonas caeni]|uniref:transporter n=1 Tax=Pseudokordiimonas caeni TaxID=2997908 RepID=UPI00281171A1|nr:transporter [Pseudokordiimonas caeni]